MGKFFLGKDDSRVKIIITIIFFGGGMASSAKVTFVPVLHEPGQPRLGPPRSHHFCLGIGSSTQKRCVTCSPGSRLVHSPDHPASMITWKISSRIAASQYWDPS